jgi:hypothetical protein
VTSAELEPVVSVAAATGQAEREHIPRETGHASTLRKTLLPSHYDIAKIVLLGTKGA